MASQPGPTPPVSHARDGRNHMSDQTLARRSPPRTQYQLDKISHARHIINVVEVVVTDEFRAWYIGLDDPGAEDVTAAIDVLAEQGVALGYPRSSAINDAAFALRELRVQSNGRPLRIFYAFDPARQAVLLIGGDKTGDNRFYENMIPQAERIWKEYLDENAQVERR